MMELSQTFIARGTHKMVAPKKGYASKTDALAGGKGLAFISV